MEVKKSISCYMHFSSFNRLKQHINKINSLQICVNHFSTPFIGHLCSRLFKKADIVLCEYGVNHIMLLGDNMQLLGGYSFG